MRQRTERQSRDREEEGEEVNVEKEKEGEEGRQSGKTAYKTVSIDFCQHFYSLQNINRTGDKIRREKMRKEGYNNKRDKQNRCRQIKLKIEIN